VNGGCGFSDIQNRQGVDEDFRGYQISIYLSEFGSVLHSRGAHIDVCNTILSIYYCVRRLNSKIMQHNISQ